MSAGLAVSGLFLRPLLLGCRGMGRCYHLRGGSGNGGRLRGLLKEVLRPGRQLLHGNGVLCQLTLDPGWKTGEKLPLEPEVCFTGAGVASSGQAASSAAGYPGVAGLTARRPASTRSSRRSGSARPLAAGRRRMAAAPTPECAPPPPAGAW